MFGSGGSGFGGFGQQNNANQQQAGQQPGQQPAGLFGQQPQQQQQQPQSGFGGFGTQTGGFGASTSGGSLFGAQGQQQQQPGAASSSGFTFGQPAGAQSASPFGQQVNKPAGSGFGGFGASTAPSSGFGGFGASTAQQQPNQAQSSPFGGASTTTFGAKPAGGGLFGAAQTQQQPQQTGAFGQPAQGGGLFGAGGGLGAAATGGMPTQGTSNPAYTPFLSNEKDATGSGSTNYHYTSISCLPAYRAASLEELRLQDYQQGRKTGTVGPGGGGFGQPAGATGFGQQGQTNSLFGQQQGATGFGAGTGGGGGGLFGQAGNTGGGGLFGQQQQQPQSQQAQTGGLFGQQQQQQPQTGGLFGQQQPAAGGFSFGQPQQQQQQPQQQSGFSFGQANQQNKPAGGGLFGQSTTGGFGSAPTGAASGGFSFGTNQQGQQPQQQQQQGAGGFGSGGLFGNTGQQQQKPATGGLFGSTTGASTGFGFGASSAPGQTENKPAFSFGGAGGGGGFGAASSAPGQTSTAAPTGGLFGQAAATSQPGGGLFGNTQANTAGAGGFSFGGANNSNQQQGQQQGQQPGQTAGGFGTGGGGLFGNKPATGGGLFGSASAAPPQAGASTGFSFGGGGASTTANNAGTGSLFGQNKPAGGGLFGSLGAQNNQQQQPGQQQQQPGGLGGSLFGNNNNSNTASTGGLFGNAGGAAGGGGGGLFGNSANNGTQLGGGGGGLFGNSNNNNNNNNNNQQQGASTGGLFGQSSNFSFGQSNNASNNQNNQSGGLFGGGNSLFGAGQQQANQQQQQQPGFNMQASLASNPYGTDSLFGGQAGPLANASPASLGQSQLGNQQGHLPFNVSMQRSTKKPPPIVAPFRPSPRSSTRITRLRGTTPGGLGLRESTPGREGSPALGSSTSLFHSPSARVGSPATGLPGSHASIFRGLSDEQPRHLREASAPVSSSTPSSLPPQAFVSRPSVKRLVLDDHDGGLPASNLTRSSSLFGGTSGLRGTPPPVAASSSASAAANRVAFSPALESAAARASTAVRNGTPAGPDTSLFGAAPDESPSRGFGSASDAADTSLPALKPGKLNSSASGDSATTRRGGLNSSITSSSTANNNNNNKKEDVLLPLDYYTEPPLSELREWSNAELRSVEGFVVGRKNYGSIEFLEPVDLTTVPELGDIPGGIVQLRLKECLVYPEEDECFDGESGEERDGVQPGFDPRRIAKAKRGQGLNQPAVVSLLQCWATDRATRAPIKDADHPRVKQFVSKLTRRQDAEFVDYKAGPGEWTFRVKHFSRYGLDDSEEDDDEEATDAAKGKAQKKKKQQQQQPSHEDDEAMESDGAPPRRALDEDSEEGEEDEATSESDGFDERSSGVMRMSEMGSPAPGERKRLRHLRQATPTSRDATPVAESPSQWRGRSTSATPQPSSRQQSQPWAASLGLEPKRVQVMQASFFGQPQTSQQQQQGETTRKQLRSFTSSEKRAEEDALASRPAFTAPMTASHPQRDTAASAAAAAAASTIGVPPPPPRKLLRTDVAQSVIDQSATSLVIDAGASLGRSFRVGWGPGGLFAHSGRPATLRSEKGSTSTTAFAAHFEAFSTVTMERARVFEPANEEINRSKAKRLLELQLQKTVVEGGSPMEDDGLEEEGQAYKKSSRSAGGCPVAYADGGLRFADFVAAFDSSERSHESLIFQLGHALFDEVANLDLSKLVEQSEGGPDPRAVMALRRKAALSGWLRLAVSATVEGEARSHIAASRPSSAVAFSYLTAHEVEKACVACLESGDVRLATLVAQASSADDDTRAEIAQQLATWRAQAVDAHIDEHTRKLFELLSGNVTVSPGSVSRSVKDPIDQVPDLLIAKGLDWKRAMGLHLWYQSSPDEPLEVAVSRYEEAVKASQGQTTAAPLPPHLDKSGSIRLKQLLQTSTYPKDVLFHLIKLYADRTYPLENICEPLSFDSGNGQDVRLAWHLYQLLSRVLSAGDFRDRVEVDTAMLVVDGQRSVEGNSTRADNLTTAYANQLESMGLWTWSAYVLLHLELASSRRTAIKALLARNVSSLESNSADVDKFLLGKLRIPQPWLCEAKADHAKATRQDRYREYQLCLEGAAASFVLARYNQVDEDEEELEGDEAQDEGDDEAEAAQEEGLSLLRRAHETVVSVLAPEALIRSDLDLILELLQPIQRVLMDAAVSMDQLAGWESGGKVLVDYVACLRNLPRLMAKRRVRPAKSFEHAHAHQHDEDDERLERLGRRVGELIRTVSEDLWVIHPSAEEDDGEADEDGQMLGWRVAKSEMLMMLQNLQRVFTSLDFGARDDAAQVDNVGIESGLPVDTEALQASAMEYCRALVGAAA